MQRDVNLEEAKTFANLVAFYDSFNVLAKELDIPKLDETQIKTCNYLGEDALRFMTSLGYLLHATIKEDENIHTYLKTHSDFTGIIIHPSKFDYNEKPVCFGVLQGKIIYTKCSTCLNDVFNVKAAIGVIALYGFNKNAQCLNYFYSSVFFTKAFFELMKETQCLPISFNDLALISYTSIYAISTGRHDSLSIGLDNFTSSIKFIKKANYNNVIKGCDNGLYVMIFFNDMIQNTISVSNNKVVGEALTSEDMKNEGDIICIKFEQFEEAQYVEIMTKDQVKQL